MIVLLQCTEYENKNCLIIKLCNHFITPINDVYNYFGVNLEDNLDR